MKKFLSLLLSSLIMLSIFACVPVNAAEEDALDDVIISDESVAVFDEAEVTYETVLTVSSAMEGLVLTWEYDGEVDSYDVYRRVEGIPDTVKIATVTDCTYTDTEAKNNTYYKYHVVAVKGGEEISTSEAILIRHLVAPTTVKATNGVKGVDVTWSKVEGALAYDIYYRGAGQTNYTLISSGVKAGTTVVHGSVKTGEYYRYAVVARCGKYVGAFNKNGPVIKHVKTPVLISATNQQTGVLFKWNKVEGATSYRVYRRVEGAKNFVLLATVKTTSYTDTTPQSGKYYKYVVKAVHGSTYSNYDTNGKVLKYVQTPKLLGIANGTDGIYVKWQLVSGANKYAIYRRGAGESYKLLKIVNASDGNRYKDTSVIACQYYRYTVRAISGNVYSGYDSNGLLLRFMPYNGTWNKAVTYNFYKYAVGKVKNDYAAGYSLKAWQDSKVTVKSPDSAFSSSLKEEFENLFGEVSTAQTKKGTAQVGDMFPSNTVAYNQVKSATCTKKGNNYVIKVVFVDVKNPNGGNDPISQSAPAAIDMVAVADAMNDISYVSKAKGSTNYTAYTITSEITADGKFVSMTHSGPCKATLDMNVDGVGAVDVDMNVTFHAKYSGFNY